MRRRRFLGCLAALLSARSSLGASVPRRVLSVGGTVTEIVYALDAQTQLVGTDQSSLYPPAAQKLPQVGYYRQLTLEGVLSLAPEVVLAAEGVGPPEVLEGLRAVGVEVHVFSAAAKVETLLENIRAIAAVLNESARGEALARKCRTQLDELAANMPAESPEVLVLTTHTGQLRAAGRDTAADAVLALAGGRNLLHARQSGYRIMGAESVAALAPEWILTSPLSLRASGDSMETFVATTGVALTPAARQGRILVLDDLLLLGFGPRLPTAIRTLREQFAAARART